MPKVPGYEGLQAQSTGLPAARISKPKIENYTPQQTMQMGAALQDFGSKIGAIAVNMQEQANKVRVADAVNQAKVMLQDLTYGPESGYANLLGVNALERPGGKPMVEEYSEQAQRQVQRMASALANDAQRELFMAQAGGLMGDFRNGMVEHEAKQYRAYQAQTFSTSVALAEQDIKANHRNVERVRGDLETIQANVYNMAALEGWSPEKTEMALQGANNAVHLQVISLAVGNGMDRDGLAFAQGYLDSFGHEMALEDQVRVRRMLGRLSEVDLGRRVANEVRAQYRMDRPADYMDYLTTAVFGVESGLRQVDDKGNPVVSSKGATGIGQLLESTAREVASGLGVEWDEQKFLYDAEYNGMLGRAYLEQMLRLFNGNVEQALAAYNAGPGRVMQAIEAAGKPENVQAGQTFMDFLPDETRRYVPMVMGRLQESQRQGGYKPSNTVLQQGVMSNPAVVNRPQAQRVASAYVLADSAPIPTLSGESLEVMGRALAHVSHESIMTLPSDVQEGLDAEQIGLLASYLSNVKNPPEVSDERYRRYLMNTGNLNTIDDVSFELYRSFLSPEDADFVSNSRQQILSEKVNRPGPKFGDVDAITTDFFRRANITFSSDPKERMQESEIRNAVYILISAMQSNTGQQLTDKNVMDVLGLLLETDTTKDGILLGDRIPRLRMTVDQMKQEDIERATAIWQSGKTQEELTREKPTNSDILAAHWMWLLSAEYQELREQENARRRAEMAAIVALANENVDTPSK